MNIEMLKNECREEGREEGLEKGREEGTLIGTVLQKKADALRMLRKGFEANIVAECVDMPLSEVQLLAAAL